MTDATQDFWKRIGDTQAGMLGLASDGELVPMSPNLRDDNDGKIYFITAKGTDLVEKTKDVALPARFVAAEGKSGLYCNIEGTLEMCHDSAIVDELWSPIAAAWFDEGREDEDIRLLAFTPKSGAAWFSTTSGAKFVYEIAKANMTGDQPDTGYQAELRF